MELVLLKLSLPLLGLFLLIALGLLAIVFWILSCLLTGIVGRLFPGSDVEEGVLPGSFWGMVIGVIVGLVMVWKSADSFYELVYGHISWTPFFVGWGISTIICSIIGGTIAWIREGRE